MLEDHEWAGIEAAWHAAHDQTSTGRLSRDPLQDVLAAYNAITGSSETNPAAVWHHRVGLYGPPCTTCGRPLRTPAAKLCASCGLPVDRPSLERHAMTTIDQLWEVIKRALPRDRWLPLQELYVLVERSIALQPDDFLPDAPGSPGIRWQRNVRNVLQSRKATGEILWEPGSASYRLATGGPILGAAAPSHSSALTEQPEPSLSAQEPPASKHPSPEIPKDLDTFALRGWLVGLFGDYHSSIALQTALVDALIQRAAAETRWHCAQIASDIGDRQAEEAGMEAADAIARAIRWDL